MPRITSSFELTLENRRKHQTLTNWLYGELRNAILEGRLQAGTRLPASRDFAHQYGLSRGIIVSVFERLLDEGYISSKVGAGTWVNRIVPVQAQTQTSPTLPAYIRDAVSAYVRPKPYVDLIWKEKSLPFRAEGPALAEFPADIWGRIAAKRARNFKSWLNTPGDGRGYQPLRDAIAHYLRTSRGVRCTSEQIMIVSGIQQALDLLARALLKPGDAVWMEDPAYFGASVAFANAGARIIAVPVDEEGLSVATGQKLCPHAKGVYLTPAHQFPLGVTMSLERRMAILNWASHAGAFVIEDDYDSEYRFQGLPVPALQSLDENSNVILVGSFSKTLFPSLRLGYIVLPPSLADYLLAFRYQTDFRNSSFDQAVLCDFIVDGHLARHLRRMRDLYAGRLEALIEGGNKYLGGLLEISDVRAGLYTVGFLQNGMTSRQAEKAAAAQGVETIGIDRYTLKRPDPKGVLLGFAAHNEAAIRRALIRLSAAWS